MKILENYRFLGGDLRGAKLPKAKDGAFISRRLKYRVGGEQHKKHNFKI
jgi:hypothetical protein